MEVADQRVLRGDREVAVDHDLEAARRRVPFEHADRRLARVEDAVEDPGRPLRDLERVRVPDEVALQLVEVEAGAEGALAAAEDHHPDLVVGLGPLDGLVELLQELLADRVALVRPVEPDSRDVPVDFVLDRLDFDCTGIESPPASVELKWFKLARDRCFAKNQD